MQELVVNTGRTIYRPHCHDRRKRRIMAEIADLQWELEQAGYELGDTVNLNAIPAYHAAWIGRIWHLGWLLRRPWLPVN